MKSESASPIAVAWTEAQTLIFFSSFFLISRETERAISWFPLTAKSGLVLRNVWLFGLYVPFNEAVSTQPFRCAAQRICHFNTMDKGVFYLLGDRLFAVAAACERKALTWIFPHCLLRDTQQKTVKPSYYRDAVNPDSSCMAVWLVVWDQYRFVVFYPLEGTFILRLFAFYLYLINEFKWCICTGVHQLLVLIYSPLHEAHTTILQILKLRKR